MELMIKIEEGDVLWNIYYTNSHADIDCLSITRLVKKKNLVTLLLAILPFIQKIKTKTIRT